MLEIKKEIKSTLGKVYMAKEIRKNLRLENYIFADYAIRYEPATFDEQNQQTYMSTQTFPKSNFARSIN